MVFGHEQRGDRISVGSMVKASRLETRVLTPPPLATDVLLGSHSTAY
jgi:hypothetical protein